MKPVQTGFYGIPPSPSHRTLRMADIKYLQSALAYAMKYESAQRSTHCDRHVIRGVTTPKNDPVNAWFDEIEKRISALSEIKSSAFPRRNPLNYRAKVAIRAEALLQNVTGVVSTARRERERTVC